MLHKGGNRSQIQVALHENAVLKRSKYFFLKFILQNELNQLHRVLQLEVQLLFDRLREERAGALHVQR